MSYIEDLRVQTNLDIQGEDVYVKGLTKGEKYHLSWASNRGYVWILLDYGDEYCTLKTPKTGKLLAAKIKDLREINRNIIKNAKSRLK